MTFSTRENEIEQYGAAVGIALSNGLQNEALDLAFTRGGGITIRQNAQGTSLPVRADLDANAVGGADATVTFDHGDEHKLRGMTVSSYGQEGAVSIERDGEHLKSISVDRDGDGKADTVLQYADGTINVDENNDGQVDMVLTADCADGAMRGFNVDLGADGTIDGFAQFVRNQNNEIKSIRFRKLDK